MASPLKHLSRPNLPEITSTTLPLLATVLAGFAVTIVATLISQPNISQMWPLPNLFWSLILLAISAPFFLTSAFFGVRAQAFSYITLSSDVQKILKLDDQDFDLCSYLDRIYKKWRAWYEAADLAFSLGLFTFILGTGLLIWKYTGLIGALLFLAIIALALASGIYLQIKESKMN